MEDDAEDDTGEDEDQEIVDSNGEVESNDDTSEFDESDRDSDSDGEENITEPWKDWMSAKHRIDNEGTLGLHSLKLFAVKPNIWLFAKLTAINNGGTSKQSYTIRFDKRNFPNQSCSCSQTTLRW